MRFFSSIIHFHSLSFKYFTPKLFGIRMSKLLLNWRLAIVEKGLDDGRRCPLCGKILRKDHKVCAICRQDSDKALVTE